MPSFVQHHISIKTVHPPWCTWPGWTSSLSQFPLLNRRFAQRGTILISEPGYGKKQLEGKSHTFKVTEMLVSISFLLLL